MLQVFPHSSVLLRSNRMVMLIMGYCWRSPQEREHLHVACSNGSPRLCAFEQAWAALIGPPGLGRVQNLASRGCCWIWPPPPPNLLLPLPSSVDSLNSPLPQRAFNAGSSTGTPSSSFTACSQHFCQRNMYTAAVRALRIGFLGFKPIFFSTFVSWEGTT